MTGSAGGVQSPASNSGPILCKQRIAPELEKFLYK